MEVEDRLEWLTRAVSDEGRLEITEVAERLGVSGMTIRRDLKELEERGVLRRVRGGALPIGPLPFADRHSRATKAKRRIAEKALEFVPDSGAIAIDASSTLLRLAMSITHARDLVVVTNGPETFTGLGGLAGTRPVLTGGALEERTGSLVGPVTAATAALFVFERCFISAAAIDPRFGPSEACIEEAEVKRALTANATEVVVCADSGKLGTTSVAPSLRWEAIDLLITELDPDDPILDPYRGLVRLH